MLAHDQGQMFNASRIGGSLGVSGQTTSRYLDLLVDLMLVRRLSPGMPMSANDWSKAPKPISATLAPTDAKHRDHAGEHLQRLHVYVKVPLIWLVCLLTFGKIYVQIKSEVMYV